MTELSRRELLRSVAAAGLGASLLAGAPSGGEAAVAGSEIAAARSAVGRTLRVSVPAPTTAVEPVTMLDPGSIALVQQVAEYLVLAGDGAALRPHLAKSWKPDANARVWTFSLRPGVFFSDGRAFRARDVARTFDRLVDPKSLSPAQTIFGGVL
jgi:peptide/nickel transport system substrate-binding protein